MKLVARRLAWLLPLALCACTHNPGTSSMQALAPPLEDAPPPPPDLAPSALPAPVVNVPKTKETIAIPPEPVKAVPKHHKTAKAAGTQASAATPSTAPNSQIADATPPAEERAIGNFETPE